MGGPAKHWTGTESMLGPAILRAFADAYPDAFFIEIGANDGEQYDHVRPILDTGRWRGIMVEPVPYVFERLRTNYRDAPQVILENAAIADRDGTLPFYHPSQIADRESEAVPKWYDGLGSFLREVVLNHTSLVPDLEDRVVCVDVPCLTFESLCLKHGVGRVDLLVIDTEGFDDEILRSIDWARHRPRLIIYEHYHLRPAQRARARQTLERLGYETKEEGFDTWCLLTRPDDALTETFRTLTPVVHGRSVHEER